MRESLLIYHIGIKMDVEKEYPAQNSTFSDDLTKFE